MAEEDIMMEEDSVALQDTDDSTVEDANVDSIIPFVIDRYKRSEDYRYQDEQRWLKAYKNYRGLYSSDVQFTCLLYTSPSPRDRG